MMYLFLVAVLIIGFLVFIMFIILKNTVNKINDQTKLYFVDKLQEYDHLIDEKEKQLTKIDKEIKEKESQKEEKQLTENKNNYEFDYNIIDLLNKTKYQDKDIVELTKKINDKFNIDYISIINKFIENIEDNDKIYNFCINLKNRFTSDIIYQIKTNGNEEEYLKQLLDNNEQRIYEAFKQTYKNTSIENFINYIIELIDLNNPTILVYVGDKQENYDHLNKHIKTKYTNDIFKGIRVVYKNKMYDFSLSERNV